MKRALFVSISTLLYLCHRNVSLVATEHTEKLREDKQILISKLVDQVAALYEKRHRALKDCDCSIHGCSYEYISDECYTELGSDDVCPSGCNGRKLDFNKTVVLTPPGIDLGNLTADEKTSICGFEGFDKIMRDYYPEKAKSWIYFGFNNGIFRNWPATARIRAPDGDPKLNFCRYYDPRLRPWYGPAATGPKNIIFVIDKSGSMGSNRDDREVSKWNETVDAISTIITTLAPTDFFNVVTYTESAKAIWTEGLKNGKIENKNKTANLLANEDPPCCETVSNFTAAFEKTFDLLINTCNNGSCSICETVILFVTDGKMPSENGYLGHSELLAFINQKQQEYKGRASIFTYSLGEEADHSLLKKIACNNNGSWFLIEKNDDVTASIKDYYLFFAVRFAERVVWAEPYIDDFTKEDITTVAMPIYTSGKDGKPREFIGVLGHDVFLFDFGNNENKTRQEIIKSNQKSLQCAPMLANPCDMQIFRNDYADAICTDRFDIESNASDENENPQCVTNGQSFYKRFSSLKNWEDAKSHCETDGGQLVNIESEKELELVAGLASDDGSWIGLSREVIDYVWINRSLPNLNDNSEFWNIGQPSGAKCVTVDSSGPIQNLNATACSFYFSFICKYANKSNCKGKPLNPSDEPQGYFKIPSLELCPRRNGTGHREKVDDEANAIDSWDVICPFRKQREDVETICCDECINNTVVVTIENDSDGDNFFNVVIALAVVCGVLVIIIWAIVQGSVIYITRKKRNFEAPLRNTPISPFSHTTGNLNMSSLIPTPSQSVATRDL